MSSEQIQRYFKKDFPKEYDIKFVKGTGTSGWFEAFCIWDAYYRGYNRCYDKMKR